jgi:hypothetical protein
MMATILALRSSIPFSVRLDCLIAIRAMMFGFVPCAHAIRLENGSRLV